MERNEAVRKMVHMCAPLFALIYLIPDDLGFTSRDVVVVTAWLLFALFEAYRIRKKIPIAGLREYEYGRPSAAFWMISAFVPMILFFPVEYALPLLSGFGFVDPLIGILRKRQSKLYPALPLITYYVIFVTIFAIMTEATWNVMLLAVIVTISAIIAEGIKNKIVDDDFLMLFVPLVVLWISGSLLI